MPLYFWEEEKKRRLKEAAKSPTANYDPKDFMDKTPQVDSSGVELPPWKRLIIAKQLAEKQMKEDEARKMVEEQEARFRDMPLWKRALIERKETEASLDTGFDLEMAEPRRLSESKEMEELSRPPPPPMLRRKSVPVNFYVSQGEKAAEAKKSEEIGPKKERTLSDSGYPSSKSKRAAPPPPTHDEDGLPLAPWQIEMKIRKSKTP